jgi:hypothetical protein
MKIKSEGSLAPSAKPIFHLHNELAILCVRSGEFMVFPTMASTSDMVSMGGHLLP